MRHHIQESLVLQLRSGRTAELDDIFSPVQTLAPTVDLAASTNLRLDHGGMRLRKQTASVAGANNQGLIGGFGMNPST
jgi:hypothetical protein